MVPFQMGARSLVDCGVACDRSCQRSGLLFWLNLVVPASQPPVFGRLRLSWKSRAGTRASSSQRQRLRNTMGLYFSPRVLKDVLENPGRLEPKRVEITVLLTDCTNSTALAERLGTEGMLNLLNRIFTVENSAVFAEDGSMEKPVGDQFLAYWGAPDPQTGRGRSSASRRA